MKNIYFFVFAFICCNTVVSQVQYETIKSSHLNSERDLKIKLPSNYDDDSKIKHPVILVFDGDYLFEPVVGQISFQTYFDEMPEAIVVGVVQAKDRYSDSYVDHVSGLPVESGAKFYEFITTELLPHIDRNYNTSTFKVVVGEDNMANFMNSYLFKDEPVFQAYVNISPEFEGEVSNYLSDRLSWVKTDVFYYMATCSRDKRSIKESILATDNSLKLIENKNLTYHFDNFKETDRKVMVVSAITKAFDKMFQIYSPLSEKEMNMKLESYDGSLSDYIKERYQKIETLFGINKAITDEEFNIIANVAIEKEDFDSLKDIGELAKRQDPDSVLGTYYIAMSAEKLGKKKKAIKLYESALMLNETELIDKETIQNKLESLAIVSRE